MIYFENQTREMSPSLRGSGLKLDNETEYANVLEVSLFTREWIEIIWRFKTHKSFFRLPLYEGVD